MNSSDEFADEIVQDNLPVHMDGPRDEFLPWHRVKKEFIRRHQWDELAIRMIKRYWRRQLQQGETEWSLDEPSGNEDKIEIPADVRLERPLRCLVFAREDLLDLRALWRDVNDLKCHIKYLGFMKAKTLMTKARAFT